MNRQLNCMISRNSDTPQVLSEELVQHGFIHTNDSCAIQEKRFTLDQSQIIKCNLNEASLESGGTALLDRL